MHVHPPELQDDEGPRHGAGAQLCSRRPEVAEVAAQLKLVLVEDLGHEGELDDEGSPVQRQQRRRLRRLMRARARHHRPEPRCAELHAR